jgi:hypothetical protein
MQLANSVDLDQPEHLCHLIRINTVHFLIHYVISDQEASIVDSGQMGEMQQLIWIYTGITSDKTRIYGVKG